MHPISFSLIGMAIKGGWLMIPLFALSILAVYIFAKKWWIINNITKSSDALLEGVEAYLKECRYSKATDLCKESDNPIARMLLKGLSKMDRPVEEIKQAVENQAQVELAILERSLPLLATISGGAPMIGFLGTVMGMIQAFYNMSQAGNNIDISLLSGGIYTAMVTTVAGLVVGIMAYFFYNYLTSKVSDIVFKMQCATNNFIEVAQQEKNN